MNPQTYLLFCLTFIFIFVHTMGGAESNFNGSSYDEAVVAAMMQAGITKENAHKYAKKMREESTTTNDFLRELFVLKL